MAVNLEERLPKRMFIAANQDIIIPVHGFTSEPEEENESAVV
jgi:hypothetical protein